MTIVVGGTYHETCDEPVVRWTYGSGVRAASVLGEACTEFVTVADHVSLAEAHAVLGDTPITHTVRSAAIWFEYYTPLHRPRLHQSVSDGHISVPDVMGDEVLVFGMVEAKPAVTCRKAVVDPQHSLSLDEIRTRIHADELAIVANRAELLALGGAQDLAAGVQAVRDATGAQVVVVKAGALGALVFVEEAGPELIPVYRTETVFPIGSGDVFTAAFAGQWLAAAADPVQAAVDASRRTAGYVLTRQTTPIVIDETDSLPAPLLLSHDVHPQVYVAASFETPEQRWSASTIAAGIDDIGGSSVYPLRDIGPKKDAATTASADLKALDECDAVVLLADAARVGPFVECGWAVSRGTPVVVLSSDDDPDRFTMLRGTGAVVVHDLATAAYHAVWAALDGRAAAAGRVLLLSGGLDSSAIAAVERPERLLFIDYGQRPAEAERTAARAVATFLSIPLDEITIDLGDLGSGLLTGTEPEPDAPTPEWFPYRNQFLVTAAAAHAVKHGLQVVLLGVVGGDGARHRDGSPSFVSSLSELLRMQERHVGLSAPHVRTDPLVLLRASNLPAELLATTHSCLTANVPCGVCPGCTRRAELLDHLT